MAEVQPLVAVLAAGRATRFGGGKLDAQCAGKRLGLWALDAVADAGLEPGVIVTGPDAPQFAQAAFGWQVLTNPAPEEGLGTSVALACRAAEQQERGVLLLLADMPLVAPAHLQALMPCRSSVATRHPDGRPGVPVLLTSEDVGRFTSLSGDRGAGKLLADLEELEVLEAPAGSLLDVDDAETLGVADRLLSER